MGMKMVWCWLAGRVQLVNSAYTWFLGTAKRGITETMIDYSGSDWVAPEL